MTRVPLDLRGLSLTELQARDAEIGNALDGSDPENSCTLADLLADRRQIRALMEVMRRAEEIPDYEIEAAKNVYP